VAITSAGGGLTFAGLVQASRAAADLFRSHGATRAVVLDTNSGAIPVALFGAAIAGIPYMPLNYRLTDAELDALLRRAEGSALIGNEQTLARVHPPAGVTAVSRSEFLRNISEEGTGEFEAGGNDNDVAVQLFTSGTTSAPKAAVLRHRNLIAYILGTIGFASAGEDEANLVTAPPYHIAAIVAVLMSVYSCRRMVLMDSFEPRAWLDMCQAEHITHGFVVPTMLSRILDAFVAEPGRWDLSSLRAIRYGGGKMPVSLIARALEVLPDVKFTNTYGMTEAASTFCMLHPDEHRAALTSDDPAIRGRLASVGRPIRTVDVEVRDAFGRALPPYIVGEIHVRGAQVAGEYLDTGSQLDTGGWFWTKDRGYLDDAGYLFLDGRSDDVIVRGGENISPGEIEDVLLDHPAVQDAAVVAVPDEEWGETIAAVIVLGAGLQTSAEELQRWVRERLRSSRVPARIEFRELLPTNDLGKVLRRVLRDELARAS
jgi:acyl-CoA synthetase (AMP-forming)/AMP-acid ligase II